MFRQAENLNVQNLIFASASSFNRGKSALRICDLGGGDGRVTAQVATAIGECEIDVVESHPPFVEQLRARGFSVIEADLNETLPLANAQYDLVISNQVIEHLYQTDVFLSEQHRILKPGGTIVVSTENAASWHNVFALIMGWQAFSLSNVTDRSGSVGNPLAIHREKQGWPFALQHHRLFATRALRELLVLHGFKDVRAYGAGYHPLPARLGRQDTGHAHFITVRGRKPLHRLDSEPETVVANDQPTSPL